MRNAAKDYGNCFLKDANSLLYGNLKKKVETVDKKFIDKIK